MYSPILSAFSSIKSHGHQQRPQLQQGREPRHEPSKQPRDRHCHSPGGNEATQLSLLLISFTSSGMSLFTGYEAFYYLSPIPHHTFICSPYWCHTDQHCKVPGRPLFWHFAWGVHVGLLMPLSLQCKFLMLLFYSKTIHLFLSFNVGSCCSCPGLEFLFLPRLVQTPFDTPDRC